MRMRRTSRLLVSAIAAVAALSLTACEDGTGTDTEGAPAPVSSPAGATRPTGTGTATTDPAGGADKGTGTGRGSSSKTDGGTSGKPATGGTAGSGPDADAPENRVLCNGSNTKVTAQPVPRPLNHMLITVTNTGSKTCDLTYYPVLRFDEMQWVPQAAQATEPQAVTSLKPGESGYAGVLLSAADGSGDGGTTAKKLTIGFQGATPNSDGGASATPSLPAGGVSYDSSLTVTYWQQSMDDALSW